MGATAESIRPNPAREFSHSLAFAYLLAATGVVSFYGIRVCPFVASLNPWTVVITFAVAFATAFLLKLAIEPRIMPDAEPFTLSVYQFFIDFGLFFVVGWAVALWNLWQHQFPIESGFKVLIGCMTFGIFAGLDNGLRRERLTPPIAQSEPRRIFPITRRLIVIFFGIAIFTGLVAALVLIKDIDFIIENVNTAPHQFLRRAVFIDIGFILLLVLILSMRLMWSYGNNLKYMLGLQIDGLTSVSKGELDTHVPIVTRDEFSLIASKTNQMIETLRRANSEQRELFEVSLALATELTLDRLLSRIVSTTRGFVDADRVSLFLHDPKTDELWSKIAEGISADELRFSSDQGIAGKVFTSGATLTVDDAYSHPDFNREFDQVTGYRTRSILGVPIADRGGDTIGVIQALNKKNGRFNDDDAARLRAFAAQAAVALVNAQLFTDLSRMKNYNESILRSLTNGVVTVDGLGRVVKANEAALQLLEESENLVGRPLDQILSAENTWLRVFLSAHQSGETEFWPESEIVLKDGIRKSVNLVSVPLADLEDHTIGAMLVIEDVTEEKRARATLSRYVPHQVAERLMSDLDTTLGGAQQKVTVLFSDIRSFTSISEALGARGTVSMLNEYFGEMAEAISDNHGVVDKYIGDAIMAVFGVPFPHAGDADHAVLAGLDMLSRLEDLNRRRKGRGKEAINIGIGLSTGDVVVGNVGSSRRMDYTVIGDTVNLAARIESATKIYGAKLVVSGDTIRDLKEDYPLRELDRVALKGVAEPVSLFQVLSHRPAAELKALAAFGEGLAAYRQQFWETAIRAFARVLEMDPEDSTSEIFIRRCRQLASRPPEKGDWNAVWRVT